MRFIKRFFVFLIVLLASLLVVAILLPNHAHVERSIVIDRPASTIHLLLNSFKRFNEWSPWAGKDPNASYVFSGPDAGVGAKLAWTGDPATVGSGSQTIISSVADQYVTTALDFGDMGQSAAKFTLIKTPQGTKLVWTLDSDLPIDLDSKLVWNLIGRYMGLFMDRMVGPDYEAGLASLKRLVESFPNVDISGIAPVIEDNPARDILFVQSSTSVDPESAKAALSAAYASIGTVMQSNGIQFAGAPLTLTTSFDGKTWVFDAAIPVDRSVTVDDSAVKAGQTPHGKMVRLDHVGSYEQISATMEKAYAWIAVQGLKPRDRMFEEYVNDPATTPVEKLQTVIRIPVE